MALTKLNNQSLSAVTSAGIPIRSGSVLQVKHAVYSSQQDVGNGYADSGVTATITPVSTSSKILIIAAMQFRLANNTNIDAGISFQIMRDSTAIFTPATSYRTYVYDGADDSEFRGSDTFSHEDSPSSTSALTYKIQGIKYAGTVVRMHDSGNQSSMTLMEIAG